MAKNKKTMKHDRPAPPLPPEPVTPAGKRLIAAGACMVVAGFAVLTKADPLGKNLAACASPFLLLLGYGAIGLGLFLPPASSLPGQAPQA